MKLFIVALALTVSANSHAFLLYTGASAFTTGISVTDNKEMAEQEAIIKDASEFYQSGKVSLALAQEIKDVQSQFEVSELEAVDMIVDYAELILASR